MSKIVFCLCNNLHNPDCSENMSKNMSEEDSDSRVCWRCGGFDGSGPRKVATCAGPGVQTGRGAAKEARVRAATTRGAVPLRHLHLHSAECKAAAVSRLADKAAAQHHAADPLTRTRTSPWCCRSASCTALWRLTSRGLSQLNEQHHLGPLHSWRYR